MHFRRTGLIFALLMFVPVFATPAQSHPSNSGMNETERSAAANLLQATNQDRSAHGLGILRPDPLLTKAAWEHAKRMVQYGRLTHQVPGEPDLIFRIHNVGLHCSTVAENIAEAPTTRQINDEWMHSPPHRANLLDPRVNAVGIAIVARHGELYAVEDFARSVVALPLSGQVGQVVKELNGRGLHAEGNQALATDYCNGSPAGTRPLPKLIMRYSTVDLSQLPGRVVQGIESGTYRRAEVGACNPANENGFTAYQIVILLY